MVGTAFADVIDGSKGANTIDGGAGADRMAGSDGNDLYIVDNAGDTVIEVASTAGIELGLQFGLVRARRVRREPDVDRIVFDFGDRQ